MLDEDDEKIFKQIRNCQHYASALENAMYRQNPQLTEGFFLDLEENVALLRKMLEELGQIEERK